jgi:HEAT repeat protein
MVDDLILLLESDDTGLRGDTAELLGNIGVKKSGPYLERLKADPDEDVRDAAMEALDKLNR